MNRSLLIRALVLLLSVVLASTPAVAAGSQGTPSMREPGLFASLMELLGSLVPALGAAQGTMDPDGVPLPETAPTSDLSSSWPAEEGDAQGTMDPDGSS